MIKKFIQCGIAGWCLEILYTGIHAIHRKDKTLMGQTSLWMFPIYGLAVCFTPLQKCMKKHNPLCRGFHYMVFIFLIEYVTGTVLKYFHCCPWDYSERSKYHVNGVIRLDYAPLWFMMGLFFEKILCKDCKK